MFCEMNTHEWHHIDNVNKATKAAARELADYIKRINRLENMQHFILGGLRIVVDDKELIVNGVEEYDENGYLMSYKSFGGIVSQAKPWIEDLDLLDILSDFENADEIECELYFSVEIPNDSVCGYGYWYKSRAEYLDNSQYILDRIIEYYDSTDEINVFSFDESGLLTDADEVSEAETEETDNWYCPDFMISLFFEDEIDIDSAKIQRLNAAIEAFGDMYECFNYSFDISKHEFICNGPIEIEGDEAVDFEGDLQSFLEISRDCGADFYLKSVFVADGGYPFAILNFELSNGKIARKYKKI